MRTIHQVSRPASLVEKIEIRRDSNAIVKAKTALGELENSLYDLSEDFTAGQRVHLFWCIASIQQLLDPPDTQTAGTIHSSITAQHGEELPQIAPGLTATPQIKQSR